MATFTFRLRTSNEVESFSIEKSREKLARSALKPSGENPERKRAGCGATISWTDMAPVSIPPELMEANAITTKDVLVLPKEARNVKELVTKMITEGAAKLTFGN